MCHYSRMTLASWLTMPQACNHITTACAISLVTRW